MEVICHITTNSEQFGPVPRGSMPMRYEITDLRIATGETTVVTGPNGVGKSGLLGEIAQSCGDGDIVETFFGSRVVSFESENIDQIEQPLEILSRNLRQTTTRYRQPSRDQQPKSIMRRVMNKHSQSGDDIIAALDSGGTLAAARSNYPRVLETINGVFKTALLPIRIVLRDGILKAKRNDTEYGIDRLSDGERAALFVAGAVLVRPKNSFILVDEPERHLNPSISGALLSALVRARTDVGFVFATHDIQLIEWLKPNQIVHIVDSIVFEPNAERRRYDLTVLGNEADLPEELRYAVLGTRRKLLLVEGEVTSEDQALYRHLYPGWNVIARGSWDTVITGVRALAKNSSYHWLTAAGIIDRDGRSETERSNLEAEGIYCLSVPTIENLFVHPKVLEQMASAAYDLFGEPVGSARLQILDGLLPPLVAESKEDIVARQLVWEGNRLLSEQKLSINSAKEGQIEIGPIDLQPLRQRIERDFDSALEQSHPFAALQSIPIKNTKIPHAAVTALGFGNFDKYKKAVLQQIESKTAAGSVIVEALREKLPQLEITISDES